ncbi:hypothetical protein GE118_00510 [Mycoplasma sp. NEAQ87857]|uniref:Smr/MutS family protein n=1 Tax=Mycoplasma sp. NEAQ87857 TaxID=2683967 RepID=UPI0013164E07|nr:Smr/MutS family protein [Mycoplasma sp. NEAQ87857]QGZ97286.1 hypothetical protein GE118_00510 [Mycoplasma sp. NEAQ87857]
MIEVDLHGLTSEQAMIEVMEYIYDFKNHKYESILFITGKGTGILKVSLEQLLEKNNISFQVVNKGGAYLIQDLANSYTYNNEYDDEEEFDDYEDLDELFDQYK